MAAIDIQNVIDCVKSAGSEILLPGFAKTQQSSIKKDGSVLTEIDLACQNFLQQKLAQLDNSIAFLGEEMDEQSCRQQLKRQRLWCVDPLDGTSNFITPFPMFATSVALIEHGQVTLACIHDPIRQETFSAVRGQGCYLNNQPIQASLQDNIAHAVGFLDFKRLQADLAAVFATKKLFRSQRNIGTCALEWAWLAAGRGQFIIHGGEKIWDYAAGSLLAEEAGCTVTNFSGSNIFEQISMTSPIIAAPSSIHTSFLKIIQQST